MVSPEPLIFDPELEQILRDVARDPRSSLLRVPRPNRPLRLADEWRAFSGRTPGLTAAERQLLESYRCEVAWLLRERWLHELIVRPKASFSLARVSVLEKRRADGSSTWQDEIEGLQADLAAERRGDLLGCLIAARPSSSLTSEQVTGLLLASERLAPSTSGKILLAQDLVRKDQPRAAVEWTRKVLSAEHRPVYRSILWDTMALAVGSAGKLRAAARGYELASNTGEPRFNPLAYWLVLAAQVGDDRGAREAASRITEVGPASEPFVDVFIAQQTRTRQNGAWNPTPSCAEILPTLLDSVGDLPRRILDVLS